MILAILAIIWGYRKANASGRNGFLWAAICGGAFIGTQVFVSFAAGAFIGTGVALWGWDEKMYDDYSIGISLGAIVASVVVLLGLFRFLDKPVAEESFADVPPPPPTFDQNDQG